MQSDRSARLRAIHATHSTDDSVIREIIGCALGQKIVSYDRIVKGESNQVYLVRIKDQTDIILRIGNKGYDRFAAEAWAMEKAEIAGVPVPTILASGSEGDVFFSIQSYLDGTPLDDIIFQGVSKARLRALTNSAGRLLARLHNVNTTGYGLLDSEGIGSYVDATQWLASYKMHRDLYVKIFAEVGLSTILLDTLFSHLDQATPLFKYSPNLLHNDYGPKHIFINEQDRIIGVIDFEECAGGDQTIDFAKWWYRYDKIAPINWLIDGYIQEGGDLYEDFEERYRIAKAVRLLGTLNYFVNEQPSQKWAAVAAKTLQRIVQS